MPIELIYAIVVVCANALGAISGMGGGIIIRPVFDVIGYHSVANISFYSSVAVFTMSIVSIGRRVMGGFKVRMDFAILTSLGSVLGGSIGSYLFNASLVVFTNHDIVSGIQIVLTILTLLFALCYTVFKWKSKELEKKYLFFVVGVGLGIIASFLGIGGGPINVAVFMLFFGMDIKSATLYSIITIFFSQLTNLIVTGLTSGYGMFDTQVLRYIVPAAIIGGLVGSQLSNKFSEKIVRVLFQCVIIGVILLNIINGIRLF